MAPAPPTRSPGSMTVSFLFGWQHILVGLVLLIALAVVFLLVLAAGRGGRGGRSEWHAYLDGRSLRRPDVEPAGEDATAVLAQWGGRPRPR